MQRERLITIDSPLKDIADDIAQNYLLRPFPTKKLANGLLDYTQLRKAPINRHVLERSIHGFINACHVAALVPVIIEFYRDHRAELLNDVIRELDELTALDIKKIQIVGMMRATGRTQDNESGKLFCEQGAAECSAYLKKLGLNSDESKDLAQSIIELESKPRSLASLVLMDATLMETFRDGVAYKDKSIRLHFFAFYNVVKEPRRLDTIARWLNLCILHANIIQKRQGYIYSGIKRQDEQLLHNDWPIDLTLTAEKMEQSQQKQLALEHDKNCFTQTMVAVNEHFDLLPTKKHTVANFIHLPRLLTLFFQQIASLNIPWNLDNNTAFITLLRHIIDPMLDEIVTDGEYVFDLSFDFIIKQLRAKFNEDYDRYIQNNFIPFHQLVLTQGENHNFTINFPNACIAQKYQQLIALIVGENEALYNDFRNKTIKKKITNDSFVFYQLEISFALYQFITDHKKVYLPIIYDLELSLKELAKAINNKEVEKIAWWQTNFPALFIFSLQEPDYTYLKNQHAECEWLIKSIRWDEQCFIDDFLEGITASPGLPDRAKLRTKPHKKFTVFAGGIYPYREKPSPQRQDREIALKPWLSKPQSTTLITKKNQPTVFNHTNDANKVVGYLFAPNDALLTRGFLQNAASRTRPFEARSLSHAKNWHAKMTNPLKPMLFEKFSQLRDALPPAGINNEAYARIRFNVQSSAVGIFSDSFAARAIAQMYADKVREILQRKAHASSHPNCFNERYLVPILYYLPGSALNNTFYQPAEQEKDQGEADKILQDVALCTKEFEKDNFEFLMIVSNPHKALTVIYRSKPIILHLIEKGLFHVADYLLKRANLPGSLGQYLHFILSPVFVTAYLRKVITKDALLKAAKAGRLDVVRVLLDLRPDLINETDNCNQTALIWAAANGHLAVVDYLLQQGAKVDTQTFHLLDTIPAGNGKTALFWAIYNNHPEVALRLLKEPQVVNYISGKKKRSPIHEAAKKGYLAVVMELIKMNPLLLNQLDELKRTPLMYAIAQGHVDMVHFLLAQPNVDLHQHDIKNKGVFHFAVEGEYYELCCLLVAAGANVQSADFQENKTILHIAASNGKMALVDAILKRNPSLLECEDLYKQTPLLWAAAEGQADMVAHLIKLGANFRAKTVTNEGHKDNGKSAFEWAISRGHLPVVEVLLRAELTDNDYLNLLNLSIIYTQLIIIKNIFTLKPELINRPIFTDFIWQAAMQDQLEIMEYSIGLVSEQDRKEILTMKNRANESLFIMAAFHNATRICELILRHGGNVNERIDSLNKRFHGSNALYIAAECKNIATVLLLLNHGATAIPNKPIPNKNHFTPRIQFLFELLEYIANRDADARIYKRSIVFLSNHAINFGTPKDVKLLAANQLLKVVQGKFKLEDLTEQDCSGFEDGKLGNLYKKWLQMNNITNRPSLRKNTIKGL